MESRTGIVHNLYELLDKCKPAARASLAPGASWRRGRCDDAGSGGRVYTVTRRDV
jgi:hypothetical protein